jgi:arylsulfatase A-like enzyme
MTGRYPSATGVYGNIGAAGGNPLREETIAMKLKNAGYYTGYFGKWHLGLEKPAIAGWDDELGVTGGEMRDDKRVTDNALRFIPESSSTNNPFALFLSYNNPHDIYGFRGHDEYDPTTESIPLPESWSKETFEGKPSVQYQFLTEDQGRAIHGRPREEWERYRDCYRAKTKLYDNHVGKIIAELKAQGVWENTLVIITSDHGDMDAHNHLIFKGPFMYEHMVRVPLMVKPPGTHKLNGKTINDIDVVNTDLYSTILDYCGIEHEKRNSRSLFPLLSGNADAYRRRDFAVSQYYSKQKWVNPIRMIRTPEYKYVKYIHFGEELYDLVNDPMELDNLATDSGYRKIRYEYAAMLDGWVEGHNDPFYSQIPTTREGTPITVQ